MGGRAGGGASGGMGSRSRSGGGSSWPTLTGSEKQVSWANDIRAGAQQSLEVIKQYAPSISKEGQAVLNKWESQMKSMTSAKQWIDARYDVPRKPMQPVQGNHPSVKNYNASIAKTALSEFNSWLGT